MAITGGWEQLGDPIGEGGQSNVYLVRRPARVAERNSAIEGLLHDPWGPFSASEMRGRLNVLLTSLSKYLRPDGPSDLGALKMFKIVGNGQESEEAVGRLRNEITILQQNRPGLIKLLDASEQERWIVTEFMPDGTIEKHPTTYKGNLLGALKAFRSLVETTASLHKGNYVHRDIKPANVFIQGNGLILGDLGIVFVPGQPDRLTVTDERVGPRDYMPQWADLGQRLENVHTNFDVYMLGKLLWCMVTGRLKLPRTKDLRTTSAPFFPTIQVCASSMRYSTNAWWKNPKTASSLLRSCSKSLMRTWLLLDAVCRWLTQVGSSLSLAGYAVRDLIGSTPLFISPPLTR